MRLCRLKGADQPQAAFYFEQGVVPLSKLAEHLKLDVTKCSSNALLDYLPPEGGNHSDAEQLHERWTQLSEAEQQELLIAHENAQILVPIAEPGKIILLAGNYAEHVLEGGEQAQERERTFPYYFWKPPTTTLTHPGDPVRLPRVSPDHVDWEIELGVIIGKQCRGASEEDALNFVAGYSVCVDVSDRKFKINPDRTTRPKDGFFDWLHGKWHDTFFPMGPCIRQAETGADPQNFPVCLKVNGQAMQQGNTAQMIFPVAALVSTLSQFVTLEPGDIISTGTPSGVGHARKPPVYLQAGDLMEAEIEGIGLLSNPIENEE